MAIATQEGERTGAENLDLMVEYLSTRIDRELTAEAIEAVGLEAQKSLREKEECPICFSGRVQPIPGHSCGIDHRCNLCKTPFERQEFGSEDPIADKASTFHTGYKTLLFRHKLEQNK